MEKELCKSVNEFYISQVCAILEDSNIPYVKKYEGAGSYINIKMGTNLSLKHILVSEENYTRASDLISVLNESEKIGETEDLEDEEDIKEKNRIKKLKIASVIWIPILILVAGIFAIISYFI